MRLSWLLFVAALPALAFTDPPRLSYSTYLPGSAVSYSAIDGSGALIFSGQSKLPCDAPPGAPQPTEQVYGFLSKLQPHGDGIAWTTCLPGPVGGLALDSAGSIYVAINTNGSSTLTKFAPNTSKVIYSTSIPSSSAAAIALDRAGNLYVAGSASAGLATTQGAYEPTCNPGSTCGFVAKLGQTGAIQYTTYTDPAPANAIAVDSHGEVWITGTAPRNPADSVFQVSFVAKLNSNGGQRLFFKTFGGGIVARGLGVSASGLGIAVDAKDAAYAVGRGAVNVPTTQGTIHPDRPNSLSPVAYIVKFDPLGNVVYGTYVGEPYGAIAAVAIDAAGNTYCSLSGQPELPNPNCRNSGLIRQASTVLVLSPDASKVLRSSTPLPGGVSALSQDENGAVYVAGGTASTAFVATPGAYQTQYPAGAGLSAFAAKVDFTKAAGPAMYCLVNAASLWAGRNRSGFDGAVAPGEIVTLFGEGFQPGPNLSVTFDGTPAPILYSDTGQINAVVPFKTGANGPFTLVSVNQGNQVIGPYQLPVSQAVPGIFAAGSNGTMNSSTNPAAPGSVVSIFLSGAGAYNPEIGDGSIGTTKPPYATPVLGVSARFGPSLLVPAEVLFVGQAPGLIAGVVQVNLRIPEDVQPGPASFAVYFGAYSTPPQQLFIGNK